MLYSAAKAGAFDLERAVLESLTSMRRAGKDSSINWKLINWRPQHLLQATEIST